MNNLWFSLLPFALFFVWLFLFGMRRGVDCPHCAEPLPSLQSPFTKTTRQWVEGGYTCRNCGCEADNKGNLVPAGTAPQRRSLIIGLGLLSLAIFSAVVLITVPVRL